MIGAIGSVSTPAIRLHPQTQTNAAARGLDAISPIGRIRDGERSAAAAGVIAGTAAARKTPAPFARELPYIPEGYAPEDLASRTRAEFPGLASPFAEFADKEDEFFRSLGLPVLDDGTTPEIFGDKEGEPFRTLGAPLDGETENALKPPGEGDDEDGEIGVDGVKDKKSAAEVMEESKCETCEKRKYQDGSDDPGVSFKFATNVDPKLAQSAVRGHEMEHVVRERAKAELEDRKVVSQSVTYHTAICPECGKFYVSGGTTRTVTMNDTMKDYLSKLGEEEDKNELGVTA